MIGVLFQGIGYGLVLAMLIGPVFFALIRTSIAKGFASGAYLAFGIALSDSFAATVVYLSIAQFQDNTIFQNYLGLLGGFLMIGFGLSYFLIPVSKRKFSPQRGMRPTQGIKHIIEGIFLNLLNPLVYIFWLGIVSYTTVSQGYNLHENFIFFLGTICTVFLTDLLKAFIADRITNYLTAHLISLIGRIAGIALVGFGLRLLFFAAYGL